MNCHSASRKDAKPLRKAFNGIQFRMPIGNELLPTIYSVMQYIYRAKKITHTINHAHPAEKTMKEPLPLCVFARGAVAFP